MRNLIPLIKARQAALQVCINESLLPAIVGVATFDKRDRMLARKDVDANPESFDDLVCDYMERSKLFNKQRRALIDAVFAETGKIGWGVEKPTEYKSGVLRKELKREARSSRMQLTNPERDKLVTAFSLGYSEQTKKEIYSALMGIFSDSMSDEADVRCTPLYLEMDKILENARRAGNRAC